MEDYAKFIVEKSQGELNHGFNASDMPTFLFPFQEYLATWALRKGRAAIFADCGLGKTPIQLVWAQKVVDHTNGRVLILTPLAVSRQTIREAAKFGITAHSCREGELHPGINVVNYEQLHKFKPEDFAGVVCDESSILKSFDGVRRLEITIFMRKCKYRLLCTATAAPNDFTELGTSSEALGYLGHMDMLNRFFVNTRNNSGVRRHYGEQVEWRFKGHAELPFWKWVCSWALAVRKPSDIGFDDAKFILPPLNERQHTVDATTLKEGCLFNTPAVGLFEEREERRRSVKERCGMVAQLVNDDKPAIVWTHMNDEANLCEKMIPGAVQVSGNDTDEDKERKLMGFVDGEYRVLVTKPKIGAWGLNFQHCAHMTFFPSHSYEQYYQSVRRCWRFGQTQPVTVDIVRSSGEVEVMENMTRKARQSEVMFSQIVAYMNQVQGIDKRAKPTKNEELPPWLSTIKQ